MAETQNKKTMSPQEAGTIFMGFIALFAYQKRVQIEALLIHKSDDLIFLGWAGVLVLIFFRLRKTHKEMAKERNELLRLRALEHREAEARHDSVEDPNASSYRNKRGYTAKGEM